MHLINGCKLLANPQKYFNIQLYFQNLYNQNQWNTTNNVV